MPTRTLPYRSIPRRHCHRRLRPPAAGGEPLPAQSHLRPHHAAAARAAPSSPLLAPGPYLAARAAVSPPPGETRLRLAAAATTAGGEPLAPRRRRHPVRGWAQGGGSGATQQVARPTVDGGAHLATGDDVRGGGRARIRESPGCGRRRSRSRGAAVLAADDDTRGVGRRPQCRWHYGAQDECR